MLFYTCIDIVAVKGIIRRAIANASTRMGCIGSKHNQVSPSSADNGSVTGDLTTSKPSAVHTTQVVEDHGMNKVENSSVVMFCSETL